MVSLGIIKVSHVVVKTIGSDKELHTTINYTSLSKDLALL